MKILLIGKYGQIGWELERRLSPLGEVVALDRTQLDLTEPDQILQHIRGVKPDVVVNAAAYTAVDKAESEPELAFAINAKAPEILASETRRVGALLVHYSTDYVFDGTKPGPYNEDDAPNPLNVYGRSKHEGERAIQAIADRYLILRTSWIYAARGRNFLLTMLRVAMKQQTVRVVDDQIGAPTWAHDVSNTTVALLAGPDRVQGIYHVCADGFTSWFGFARAIFDSSELARLGIAPPILEAIPSSGYPRPARRPRNSTLDCARLATSASLHLAGWREALAQCMSSLPAAIGEP